MTNVLLVDTNFSAKPIYDYLSTIGSEVFVVGGNPEDALAKSVKNYVNLDYSNVTEVKKLIQKIGIDYLVPGGNDLSYKICSEISKEFNFYNIDQVETNEIITHKEKFRRFASELNLHVPHLLWTEHIKDSLPIIVKPVDSYSGHGITILYENDAAALEKAINLAKSFSKSGNFLIEEYVQGQLYSHSAFIVNGEIIIDFIVEEHCTVNPYVVDTSYLVFDFNENILSQIRRDISKLSKKLQLSDGLIHTQFISNGNQFWLIEATRRCPGDLYSKLIEYSTGFPYAEYYASSFINAQKQIADIEINKSLVMRHTITLDKPALLHSVTFNNPISDQTYIPLALTGDQLKESPFSRVALLFGFCDSKEEFEKLLKRTINRNLYSIE